MRIFINDKEAVIPSSLSEITLGQRIDFHNQHGKELDEMLESIIKMEEGIERELETTHFQFEKMFRTFSFFSNVTVESVKESKFIDDIASIYYSCLSVLFDDEQALDLQQTFQWNNDTWVLEPPEIKHGGKMKFGEFVDAKQVVKNMDELGKGKWEYMLPLCAIYLRKKDEPYQEEFLYEGSDRLELMKKLPMNIAMQVGFFLTGTLNIYENTLRSFGSQKQSQEVGIPSNTSTDTAG